MKKNTLVQFVCFKTILESDQFVPQWEQFAKATTGRNNDPVFLQQATSKSSFKYVSQHQWPEDDFQFVFMKGRHSENLPESRARVVQAGGYIPVQLEHRPTTEKDNIKIMAFSTDQHVSFAVFKKLQPYQFLNIYQAYYESSIYAVILEYFLKEKDAALLLSQLKELFPNMEAAIYKECFVPVE
ncbi:MAG TPA: hypothetical protein VHD35_09480 [Chitinophagaceae bacterium]|nr:hypothetical protein [Chitinophagaceae bacterium]